MIKYMQRRPKVSEVRKLRYKDLEELYYSNYKLVYVYGSRLYRKRRYEK